MNRNLAYMMVTLVVWAITMLIHLLFDKGVIENGIILAATYSLFSSALIIVVAMYSTKNTKPLERIILLIFLMIFAVIMLFRVINPDDYEITEFYHIHNYYFIIS